MDKFLENIYALISQHLAYVKRLQQACANGTPFEHRAETECNFGRLFYGEIYARVGEFPDDIQTMIIEIERLHKVFHCQARQAHPDCGEPSLKAMYMATDLLIIRLTKLEKVWQTRTRVFQPATLFSPPVNEKAQNCLVS